MWHPADTNRRMRSCKVFAVSLGRREAKTKPVDLQRLPRASSAFPPLQLRCENQTHANVRSPVIYKGQSSAGEARSNCTPGRRDEETGVTGEAAHRQI